MVFSKNKDERVAPFNEADDAALLVVKHIKILMKVHDIEGAAALGGSSMELKKEVMAG